MGKNNGFLKQIEEEIASTFGAKLIKETYSTDDEKLSVDILKAEDCPCEEVNSYATLGASLYPNVQPNGNDIRVEFVALGYCEDDEVIQEILSTCAYLVMDGEVTMCPYFVIQNILDEFLEDSEMKHILLIRPFGWRKELAFSHIDDQVLSYLMICPISDKEFEFLRKQGVEKGPQKLMAKFQQEGIDICDLERESIF